MEVWVSLLVLMRVEDKGVWVWGEVLVENVFGKGLWDV